MATKKEMIARKIIDFLSLQKDGQSIETIRQALPEAIDIRSLQRRLKSLREQGVIVSTGKARATVYQLIPGQNNIPQTVTAQLAIIPLSGSAERIQQIISLPTQQREPVGYHLEFLENYIPNETSYLTSDEKKHLATIGVTAQINSPAGTYAKQIMQRLLVDLAWNSSRLEGNTYSLLDTQLLLEKGTSPDDKTTAEAQMILN